MLVSASCELKFHNFTDENIQVPGNLNIFHNIINLSWSKNNHYLILLQEGGNPEILNLKDISNIRHIHTITAIDNITVALFQRNTKKCVGIGTSFATVALYDTQTKSVAKLFCVSSPVVSMDFNNQDKYLGVACSNGKISILNIVDYRNVCNYAVDFPSILIFHQTRINLFAVGTEEGSVFVFEVEQPNPYYTKKAHINKINGLVFTQKNNLITVGGDNKFCVHDYQKKTLIYGSIMQYSLTCIDITSNGNHFAIGTNEGKIFIFETDNYLNPLISLNAHNSSITCLKYSNGSDTNIDLASLVDSNLESFSQYNESDFESLCNKYIKTEEAKESLKLFKTEYVSKMKKSVRQARIQMKVQTGNLQEYIAKESEKINVQVDDKLDLLSFDLKNFY